ncbi:MAG: MBL fold metallo-hydrolase [Symploca sp. SIO2E9]|nr:MBL fold metallo-hydrolase [Symploca sp. SIO2E9]
MRLTYFGSNSWLLELGQQRILIDPWLLGSLVFGNAPWFFKAEKPQALDSLPEQIDLILLSQGLEDHAHKPTLEKLDRSIPVVGSISAAKVVQQLGYTQVTTLIPTQTFTLANQVEISSLPGAPIGLLQTENAYLIKQLDNNTTLYYEPHGYPPSELKDFAPVDVVISPAVSIELPLLGPIIQGNSTALQLIEWVKPQVFLPTATGGEVKYQGMLNSLLKTSGSVEELRSQLKQRNLATQVIELEQGKPWEVKLASGVS